MGTGEDYSFGLAVLNRDIENLYAYDGDGNRVRSVSAITLNYVLDVQPGLTTVLAETTGAITTRYIHGPTGIHAQQNAGGDWRWLLQDGLGSVRAVANTTDVIAAQQYSPYGVPLTTMTETDFGFTGELTDDNDLVYLRARYLHPGMGVFAGLDPFEGEEQLPLTLNGYGWVESNPINLVDASGMASMLATSCDKSTRLSGLSIPRVSGCWTLADYVTGDCPGSGAGEGVIRGSRGGSGGGQGVVPVEAVLAAAIAVLVAPILGNLVQALVKLLESGIEAITDAAGARQGPWGGRAPQSGAIPQSGIRGKGQEIPKTQGNDESLPLPIPMPYTERVEPDEEDPCSIEVMRRRLQVPRPSDVVYGSPLADRVNGRRVKPGNQPGIERESVAWIASEMCRGSRFEPIPIFRGNTHDTLLDGHHRFVASRLVSIPPDTYYTTRVEGLPPVTPNMLRRGDLPTDEWFDKEWIG